MNYLINIITDEIYSMGYLEYNILIIICIISLITLSLRIILTVFYSGQKGLFKLNAKEIKAKEDIKNTKYHLLNKIVNDFQKTGEKGIAHIDVKSIVKRHINGLNFMGLSYKGMGKFILDFEIGIIGAGFILAVICESPYIFSLVSIFAFIVFRFASLIFNFKAMEQNLIFDIQNYIEREIGQFYIGDISSSIQRLKVELIASSANLANIINLSMEQMANKMADLFNASIQEIKYSFEQTIADFMKFGEKLDAPFERWKDTIEHAFDAQHQINVASEVLSDVVKDFNKVALDLQSSVIDYNLLSSEQSTALKTIGQGIQTASESFIKEFEHIRDMNAALKNQISVMEENQKLLEKTVQEYEYSLKMFTQDAAQAFVSMTEHGMKNVYETLNSELRENLGLISAKNLEAAEQITKQIQNMDERSSMNMQAIVNLKDQIDVYFEAFNRRE